MRYLNIVIKKTTNIFYANIVLFALFVFVLVRIYTSTVPSEKQKDFSTTVLLTNPVIIQDSQFVLNTSTYKVYTHNPLNYEMGKNYNVRGNKYYNAIYANNIKESNLSLFYPLFRFKTYLVYSVKTKLSEPFSSILLGMLYGVEPDFSKEFKDSLVKAGVVHVLVVSGFNIAIIFTFINNLLVNFSSKKRFIISSLVAVTFTVFSGFEPPIIRAVVFGIIVAFGKIKGQVVNTLYVLILTALLMTFIDPLVLFSVSFQLSFFACLGLLLLSTPFKALITRFYVLNKLPNEFIENFVSTLSAQIFVTPLLLYYFSSISIVSLFTNTFILWLVPIIMLSGFIFSIIALFPFAGIYYLSFIVLLPLIVFVDFSIFMSKVPYSTISLTLNVYFVFITYFLIICLVYALKRLVKTSYAK